METENSWYFFKERLATTIKTFLKVCQLVIQLQSLFSLSLGGESENYIMSDKKSYKLRIHQWKKNQGRIEEVHKLIRLNILWGNMHGIVN